MHTIISVDNPHGMNRYGFAWEHIPQNCKAHLDFGCDDGYFMNSLKARGIENLVGLDASSQAIAKGKEKYPKLDIRHITQTAPLPFADESLDSISMLDVLEHVYRQPQLLAQCHRLLRPGGTMIITVPGEHIFSFLDRGNIQLWFPRVFKWYYLRNHTPAEYERNYVNNPDNMVGCMSAKKRLHEHFSRAYLGRLLKEAGFEVEDFDGAGYFFRLIETFDFAMRLPRTLQRMFDRIKKFDTQRFESCDLFCVATKQ